MQTIKIGNKTLKEYTLQLLDGASPIEVWGGELDVDSGELTVTHGEIASYSGQTLPGKWISDRDVYTPGGSPTPGAQVVYELATPMTFNLSPTEVRTFLGDNSVWADTGNTDLKYSRDTETYLNKNFNDKTDNTSIATVEETFTATKNYVSGALFIINGQLYKTTAAVASGSAFVIGTNCVEETIEAQLALKQQTLDQIQATVNNMASVIGEGSLSYSQISDISKSGDAEKYFSIGDQIQVTWNDGTTNYDMPFDIVSFAPAVNSSNETVPAIWLQSHWVLPGVQFDSSEAIYVASSSLPAGTYNFTIGTTWGSHCVNGKVYQFTTTAEVPAGGQILVGRSSQTYTWGAPDYAPSTWKVFTFASNSAESPIESNLALTEGSGGTALGTLSSSQKYSASGMNNLQRAAYGYNRWSHSAMRKYLNSDAAAGSWWEPSNPFDRTPEQLSSKRGFLAGLSPDFLEIVNPVKVTTALNTVSDTDLGTSEDTYDRFFLASLEQEYSVPQLSGVEGSYWPYWKERLGLNSPQQWYGDYANANHIRYLISNHTSAQNVRLRSALRGYAINTWYVYTAGYVHNGTATYAYCPAPACVIC